MVHVFHQYVQNYKIQSSFKRYSAAKPAHVPNNFYMWQFKKYSILSVSM
jgi:hypothetical protein